MANGIFISYRRSDSEAYAGRLFDHLDAAFPASMIFMDVDSLMPGVDFVADIERRIKASRVLLVIIGDEWVSAAHADGTRRLDNPGDLVRLEIELAMKQGCRIIPVLVSDAEMPRPDQLPDSLVGLTRLNAVTLRHARFRDDADFLANFLAEFLDTAKPEPVPDPTPVAPPPAAKAKSGGGLTRLVAIVAILVVVGVGGWFGGLKDLIDPNPPVTPEKPKPPAEQTAVYSIILVSAGATKINVIKEVRAITELGLKDAKALVEAGNIVVSRGVSKAMASEHAKRLKAAGATIKVVEGTAPSFPDKPPKVVVKPAEPKINLPREDADLRQYSVRLLKAGPQKITVIKEVRAITGLGLKDAKELVEAGGRYVTAFVTREEASDQVRRLKAAGAKADVKVGSRSRLTQPKRNGHAAILDLAGRKKTEVIGVIRQVSGIGSIEAKTLAETKGAVIVDGTTSGNAQEIVDLLKAQGATARVYYYKK